MSEQTIKEKRWYEKTSRVIILALFIIVLSTALSFIVNLTLFNQNTITGEVSMRCEGATVSSKEITFSKPFKSEPSVILTVGDVDEPGFYNVSYSDVTKKGFIIHVYSVYEDDIKISFSATATK